MTNPPDKPALTASVEQAALHAPASPAQQHPLPPQPPQEQQPAQKPHQGGHSSTGGNKSRHGSEEGRLERQESKAIYSSAEGQVALKLQYISDRQAKLHILALFLALALALGVMIWLAVVNGQGNPGELLAQQRLTRATLPMASLCVAAALATALVLCRRLWWVRRSGKQWTRQQRHAVGYTALSLVLQGVNASLWLANLIIAHTNPCGWYKTSVEIIGGLQFTLWNTLFFLNIVQASKMLPTGGLEAVAEALQACCPACCPAWCGGSSTNSNGEHGSQHGSATKHSSGLRHSDSEDQCQKLDSLQDPGKPGAKVSQRKRWADSRKSLQAAAFVALWIPIQVCVIVLMVQVKKEPDATGVLRELMINRLKSMNITYEPIELEASETTRDAWLEVPTYILGVWLLLASLAGLLLMRLALLQLGNRPYHEHRVRNLAVRLALRTRVPNDIVLSVSIACIWWVNVDSCTSLLEIWLGMAPLHIAMTATVVTEAFLFMPSSPSKQGLKLHQALQKFAWTERAVPSLLQQRGFPEEPCFCFETAIKTAYLSVHCYSHFKPEAAVTNIDTAMELYGCSHYEWLREPEHDSNCLLCWGPDTLVVVFRGTASMANVRADAKIWRDVHPPQRGSRLLGTRPLVHTGFLQSWTTNDFNIKVLQRIREILEGRLHSQMQPMDCTVDGCCGRHGRPPSTKRAGASSSSSSSSSSSDDCSQPEGNVVTGTGGVGSGAEVGKSGDGNNDNNSSSSNSWGPGLADEAGGQGAADLSDQTTPFRILLAGHSLGGAMTHMCGIDLGKALPEWGFQVVPAGAPLEESMGGSASDPATCRPAVSLTTYTFGAPRTGNHAFARDYGAVMPDCWSIINGQDAVANLGKFWGLFKRPGKPVLLSRRGDLIVRPSNLEHLAHRTSGASIKQHLILGSYCPSLAAVLRAQVSHKPMPGGQLALDRLKQDGVMAQVLEHLLSMGDPEGRKSLHSHADKASAAQQAQQALGSTAGETGAGAGLPVADSGRSGSGAVGLLGGLASGGFLVLGRADPYSDLDEVL